MPIDHRVKSGECLLSIATANGFFPDTLWNHAKNRELKSKREDPNVLRAGDVVHIPDLTRKDESKAVDRRHRFRRKGVPGKFKVQLLDNGEPLAGLPYRLTIDGDLIEGKTDSDGYVEHDLPAEAQRGELKVEREGGNIDVYTYNYGTVDPVDTEEGALHRLSDLGYKVDGPFEEVISYFQYENELEETGKLDDETQKKLEEVFGQ